MPAMPTMAAIDARATEDKQGDRGGLSAIVASAKAHVNALAAVQPASMVDGRSSSAAPPPTTAPATFQLVVTGQIESIVYPGLANAYCRYAITYGTDWRVIHGADQGLTQLAYRSNQDDDIVLNFPIDISFKSTNPFGWPRIVFSVYGLDGMGRDIVRGYGTMALPTCGGQLTRQVPLFRPVSSSLLQQFTAWLTGSPPEYFDSKFITQNDGREVTRVASAGRIRVQLNAITKGMRQHGYSES